MFRKHAKPSGEPPAKGLNASVVETAPCERSLRVQIGHEAIAPIRAGVVAEFQRQSTLPGFRKGKAPVDLVERQHAHSIQEETLSRATRQALEQIAKEHALKPVGPFEVRQAKLDDADGLRLEAVVEVEPAFALGPYKGIPLQQRPVEVTPEELQQALAQLQESMAQLVPAAKEGEPKQRQVPPLDDELAKDLGFKTLAQLQEHVAAKLREQRQAARAQALEVALCDELLRRHAFSVPSRLVAHQAERLTRDFKARLLLSGKPEDSINAEAAKFAEQLRTSAERHVKLGFIIERIAEQESITVTQDELVGRLWQLAQRWKKDPAETRKLLDAEGLWPSVVSAIRQEKTMARLLGAAAIEPAAAPQPSPVQGREAATSPTGPST